MALERTGVTDLLVVGGVARNTLLRQRATRAAGEEGFRVHFPPPQLCTDNAAMIAALGFKLHKKALMEPLDINAYSTKSMRSDHRKPVRTSTRASRGN
jgi:N6-L-threonylcarbamoyladenine synthase